MGEGDERLLTLADAGRRFGGCRTLGELLPLAGELALEVLQASSASVSRIEHQHGILRVLHNVGALAPWEEPTPQDEVYDVADFPLLAAVIEHARPWFGDLGDPATGHAHNELLLAMGMASSISLPILVGSRVWGEIGAARDETLPSFSPGDAAAGEAFCGLLGAAIARIEEHDVLRALAFNDALTGLANRRAIDDRLEAVFAQDPPARPVALVLGDVDGLKRVNDTYGHDAGDRVLREVATMLSRVAGSFPDSLAVRLGGDEFCLLLEDVSESEVRAASDALTAEAAGLPLGAGLSCGWAWTAGRPGDAPTATSAARALLRLADAAQYRSKRAGRGQPVRASDLEVADITAASQRVVDRTLIALQRPGATVVDRLRSVAMEVAVEANAAGWAVSRSVDGAALQVVVNHGHERLGRRTDHPVEPAAGFDPAAYPATAAALTGGGFHATVDHGDDAERAFLAAYGFDELIGAGAPGTAGTAWLVEVAGDALSPSIAHLLPVLQSLVALAVMDPPTTGRRHGSVSAPNAAP